MPNIQLQMSQGRLFAFLLPFNVRTTVVTDVAVDHDSKNQESTVGDFGAPHCSCFLSSSYSYSKRSSISILPIGPQVPANRFDQRSASSQFKQPSSTSTVSLSTVRRGGLSTSTTKSEARARTKRSPWTRSCVTSIRDAVCPRPPVGSSDRKHSFIS